VIVLRATLFLECGGMTPGFCLVLFDFVGCKKSGVMPPHSKRGEIPPHFIK
jgi:hypothetical protein